MQSTTTSPFPYLRSKLQEWKSNDLLHPTAQLSWERFQGVATTHILPVLHEVKSVMESEGLDVSITDLEDETRSIGFYVTDYDLGLFFWPGSDAAALCFAARRLTEQAQGYEARIRYRKVKPEPLRRLVEEALLRLLGPRRSHGQD